jgi:hypothetical protein
MKLSSLQTEQVNIFYKFGSLDFDEENNPFFCKLFANPSLEVRKLRMGPTG